MATTMNPSDIYALRTANLLTLPATIRDIIATMQVMPVAHTYAKKPTTFRKPPSIAAAGSSALSWRQNALVEMKKMVLRTDDPDYETIVGISNKVATSTIGTAAASILALLQKRDEMFRLRVVSLLFNRGVSMPFFSKLMANLFEILLKDVPLIKEDLQFSCSIDIFHKMFDQTETIVYPSSADPAYDDKICQWMKRKEIRRGFGMFVTELHLRGLVDEDVIVPAMTNALDELVETVRKPTDKSLIESADQLTTFLFDSVKALVTRFGKTHPIVKLVTAKAKELYAIPKTDTPCLGMRSRFKLDDVSKL